MKTVNTFHVEPFFDNDSNTFTYVVSDLASQKAVVIDPVLDFDYSAGKTTTSSVEKIAQYIDDKGLALALVLETHAHADHISGAPYFRQRYGARIGIGREIKTVQKTFKDLFNLEKEFLPNGSQFDDLYNEGDEINVGNLTFKVMHVPGHTPADVAYYLNDEVIFVGDTLFMPDVGTARCDFPGGDANTLFESINRILALPEDTQIYLCHDYPPAERNAQYKVTVAEQKAYNKHVKAGTSKQEFVQMRQARDATLSMPRLILPSVQINIRAGELPPKEDNGVTYLKVPINQL